MRHIMVPDDLARPICEFGTLEQAREYLDLSKHLGHDDLIFNYDPDAGRNASDEPSAILLHRLMQRIMLVMPIQPYENTVGFDT